MDIRPGHSPGSIFGAADNNPLVQSFDEESPDSVLNPDGSVGYLAARLSKERGATAERLKTISAMEQRGDIDSKEKLKAATAGASVEALLAKYDKSGDGMLDKKELTQLIRKDLKLGPVELKKSKEDLALSEIKHGRAAMMAITGFAVQEFVWGTPVVKLTPMFFRGAGESLVPPPL